MQSSAQFHPRDMPAPQNVMEEALRVGETGDARWQLKAIYDATENDAIAWVSVGYLMSIADAGGVLQRRQDIPRDAFLTVEEVKNQALYVLQYRWLSQTHPDPEGFYLKQLVEVLKKEKAHPRDGVFWEFASLYQSPHTDYQYELFKVGLRAFDRVRMSFRVACIVLPDLPEGFTGSRFWESGWDYVEFLQSSLCQRIVTAKEPAVSEHMVPEWLVGWRERLQDMAFTVKSDRGRVEAMVARTVADFPVAKTDAVGFVVACAMANYRFVRCWFLRELAARGGPSPRRQDLPDNCYVDGHVPVGQQLWVVSYPWSAQTHPSPGGQKIRELVRELDNQGATEDDVVFLDHMSLWQGAENVPEAYLQCWVKGAKSAGEGMVTLPDRTEEQLNEFKFALFETTRLYAFKGGNLPDGTEVKGCRVVVLPGLDNYKEFPDRGECVKTKNEHCEPPRLEVKTKWGFSKSVPYHLGGWTTAEYTVARYCGTICNGNSPAVRAVEEKRSWPTSVAEFAAMMDEEVEEPVRFTKRGDRDAVRFNFWKYCFRFQ